MSLFRFVLTFSQTLEKILLPYIKALAAKKKPVFALAPQQINEKDLKFFSRAVRELSDLFTKERAGLPSGYLNHLPWRIAYLLYFLPINFAKACFAFEKLPQTFWEQSEFKVLDLGCGPASASLAFLYVLERKNKKAKLEIQLVDQNKKILGDAEFLLKAWQNEKSLKNFSFQSDSKKLISTRFNKKFDLIIFHHVINEMTALGAVERARWLSPFLFQYLSEKGLVAIIEPALKRPTREMMALRNHLIEENFQVLAPCLHQQTCPMLASTLNDWCHFYANWEEPAYLKKLDRMIGNNNRYLKLAYLILSRKDAYLSKYPHDYFRMVSNRMATRGKTEVALCGPAGGVRLTRLDRNRSTKNRDLDQSKRGDILKWGHNLPKTFSNRFDVKLGVDQVIKAIKE